MRSQEVTRTTSNSNCPLNTVDEGRRQINLAGHCEKSSAQLETKKRLRNDNLPDDVYDFLNSGPQSSQGNVESNEQQQGATTDQPVHRPSKRARTLSEHDAQTDSTIIILPNSNAEQWNPQRANQQPIQPANESEEPSQNESLTQEILQNMMTDDPDLTSILEFDETFTLNG